jgi:hypothetical protein
MFNNNFIGALIAILVSILFAININNNNKKEPYAGGMPSRKLVSQKIAAFVPNDCSDPSKVQFYSVSNFQSNPSQRGTNPEVGALLRTQLNNPSRLSNDLKMNFDPSCSTANVESFQQNYTENFADMVQENYSTYEGLPTVDPEYSAGNYNELKNKDVMLSDMMPVGDMRAAVDDEGNPGNIYQFERFMYSNLKDNRNVKDADFIRGDLAIPPNKGSCWFGQRGYSLRPSALGMLGGSDLSNTKKLEAISTPYRNISSSSSAAMGDLVVENQSR